MSYNRNIRYKNYNSTEHFQPQIVKHESLKYDSNKSSSNGRPVCRNIHSDPNSVNWRVERRQIPPMSNKDKQRLIANQKKDEDIQYGIMVRLGLIKPKPMEDKPIIKIEPVVVKEAAPVIVSEKSISIDVKQNDETYSLKHLFYVNTSSYIEDMCLDTLFGNETVSVNQVKRIKVHRRKPTKMISTQTITKEDVLSLIRIKIVVLTKNGIFNAQICKSKRCSVPLTSFTIVEPAQYTRPITHAQIVLHSQLWLTRVWTLAENVLFSYFWHPPRHK